MVVSLVMRGPFPCSALAATLLAAASAAAQPAPGMSMRYTHETRMHDGTGAYAGYTDATTARGHYEITAVDEVLATVHATHEWHYVGPERQDSGQLDRVVDITLATRRYATEQTDREVFDDRSAAELATWLWIPRDVAIGDRVAILDRDFVVVQVEESLEIAGGARTAIEVEGRWSGERDDAYGRFATEVVDRYWFDRATGMFLRELHLERATGTYDGTGASFTMETNVDVIDATWAPSAAEARIAHARPPGHHALAAAHARALSTRRGPGVDVYAPLAFLASLAMVLFFFVRSSSRAGFAARAPTHAADGRGFTISKGAPASLALPSGLGEHLGPFLPHLVEVARSTGSPIAIARAEDGEILGIGLGDREAGAASIFAPDSDACEAIRRALGSTEHFSEIRHPAVASAGGTAARGRDAYEVGETYDVLAMRGTPADLADDTNAVRPMIDADRDAVATLLRKVLGIASTSWLDGALGAGGIGYVAIDDTAIVGFAMVTVIGEHARLHGLVVLPGERSRELVASLIHAPLRAALERGATEVITEIATSDTERLEIARALGLVKVGTIYLESTRESREPRRIIRR
jgi:hypothetical protein